MSNMENLSKQLTNMFATSTHLSGNFNEVLSVYQKNVSDIIQVRLEYAKVLKKYSSTIDDDIPSTSMYGIDVGNLHNHIDGIAKDTQNLGQLSELNKDLSDQKDLIEHNLLQAIETLRDMIYEINGQVDSILHFIDDKTNRFSNDNLMTY